MRRFIALGAQLALLVGLPSCERVAAYRAAREERREAWQMLQAIAIAEEAYRAEVGSYGGVSRELGRGCPVGASPSTPVRWEPSCSGGLREWTFLPLHVDGAVRHEYSIVAKDSGIPLATFLQAHPAVTAPPTEPADWFVILAVGSPSVRTYRASWSTEVVVVD